MTCPKRNTPVLVEREHNLLSLSTRFPPPYQGESIPHHHPFATWYIALQDVPKIHPKHQLRLPNLARLSRGPLRPPNLSLRSQTTTSQPVRLAFVNPNLSKTSGLILSANRCGPKALSDWAKCHTGHLGWKTLAASPLCKAQELEKESELDELRWAKRIRMHQQNVPPGQVVLFGVLECFRGSWRKD